MLRFGDLFHFLEQNKTKWVTHMTSLGINIHLTLNNLSFDLIPPSTHSWCPLAASALMYSSTAKSKEKLGIKGTSDDHGVRHVGQGLFTWMTYDSALWNWQKTYSNNLLRKPCPAAMSTKRMPTGICHMSINKVILTAVVLLRELRAA